MKSLLRIYLIITLSIYLVSHMSLGFSISKNLESLFYASLILFILLMIKPIIDTILFPINLLTLSLTKWLTYILFIFVWSVIAPDVKFMPFSFSGIKTSIVILPQMMITYWMSVLINSLLLIFLIKFFKWLAT